MKPAQTPLVFAAATLLAAGATSQNPDILVPSGSLDGIYRLVDRNGNGNYDDDGDAYDYLLNGVDSSIRNIVLVPGTPPRLYCTSTVLEQILSMWDADGDGEIDPSTEMTVALDFPTFFGSATHEVNSIAHAGGGVFYVTNDSGDTEGVLRCEDLTGDGDFDDPGETTNAAVEPTQLTVNNAPNSGNPLLSVTALDSIQFDPTWGASGRFLLEEENFDFSLALEDMNGDGDFDDAGEAYLFSALWNGGTLGADVNPDVANGRLPVANEIREHAVATSTTPATYYLLSADTSSAGPDNAVVFRGIDHNQDGDVNDSGEINVFWDGSLDSTGAVAAYNFCYGIHVDSGKVWVTCEWDGSPDEEQVVLLEDNNGDGDADDAGELTVLWSLPADRTHYDPLVVAGGTLPAAPAGLPGTYNYFGDATCATSLPGNHNVQVGTDNFNDKIVIGNAGFMMRTWGANPNSMGIYNVSVAALGAPIPIDPPANLCNIYLLPIVTIGFATDATGQSNDPIPIPNNPGLIGSELFWQSAVIDPILPIGVTSSDAARMRIGAYSYSVN